MALPLAFNMAYLDHYSSLVAKKLCDVWFKTHVQISGEEIKNFAPVPQVNKFVTKSLLLKWKEEVTNLRSPYFAYENAIVKEALANFMNTLSHNISIKRGPYELLLSVAIKETIMLAASPIRYFDYEIDQLGKPSLAVAKLRDTLKFYTFNKEILEEVLAEFALQQKAEALGGEFKREFYRVVKEKPSLVAKPDEILSKFNGLSPLVVSKIFEESESGDSKLAPVQPNMADDFMLISRPEAPSETTSSSKEPLNKPVFATAKTKDTVKPVAPVNSVKGSLVEEAIKRTPTLNEAFENHQNSINTTVSNGSNNLLNRFKKSKIESIAGNIQHLEKFQFINELFDKNETAFNSAVNVLDMAGSKQEALDIILNEYGIVHSWDWDHKTVRSFINLVERRYAAY